MYLVLYCHNIGMTDFSHFESDDFDQDEGYTVRGKWANEQAFRAYLTKEFGDMSEFTVIDLSLTDKPQKHSRKSSSWHLLTTSLH